MSRPLTLVSSAAVVALGVSLGLWAPYRPPEPSRIRATGASFADVTVIEPGRGRIRGRTVVLRGDRIAEVRATGPGDGSEPPHAASMAERVKKLSRTFLSLMPASRAAWRFSPKA